MQLERKGTYEGFEEFHNFDMIYISVFYLSHVLRQGAILALMEALDIVSIHFQVTTFCLGMLQRIHLNERLLGMKRVIKSVVAQGGSVVPVFE